MDPTQAEVSATVAADNQLQELVDWAGVSEALLAGMHEALGEFRTVRDLVRTPLDVWNDGLSKVMVADESFTEREMKALEWGQVGSLRRAARMVACLKPDEFPPAPPTYRRDNLTRSTAEGSADYIIA